jgi:hypothetical protein
MNNNILTTYVCKNCGEEFEHVRTDGEWSNPLCDECAMSENTTECTTTKEVNFVEDIDWSGEAKSRGEKILSSASIGYDAPDFKRFAARLESGKILLWDDGEFTIETPQGLLDQYIYIDYP